MVEIDERHTGGLPEVIDEILEEGVSGRAAQGLARMRVEGVTTDRLVGRAVTRAQGVFCNAISKCVYRTDI